MFPGEAGISECRQPAPKAASSRLGGGHHCCWEAKESTVLLWGVLWADVGDAPAARGQWLLALRASWQACGRARGCQPLPALLLPAPILREGFSGALVFWPTSSEAPKELRQGRKLSAGSPCRRRGTVWAAVGAWCLQQRVPGEPSPRGAAARAPLGGAPQPTELWCCGTGRVGSSQAPGRCPKGLSCGMFGAGEQGCAGKDGYRLANTSACLLVLKATSYLKCCLLLVEQKPCYHAAWKTHLSQVSHTVWLSSCRAPNL